jgi:L-rhamnose mutarotase
MVRRFGWVIGLREECIEDYERYHAAVWPDVLAAISRANIRNYSIFRLGTTLFGYQEYWGTDYEADMAVLDADPATLRWLEVMHPMQVALPGDATGQWRELPEVFHLD